MPNQVLVISKLPCDIRPSGTFLPVFRLTQGVVKRIIPAVASTNAVIAATCAMEVFKVATSCANPLQNYMVFNDSDGIYTYAYEAARNEECLACQIYLSNYTNEPKLGFCTSSVRNLCQDHLDRMIGVWLIACTCV